MSEENFDETLRKLNEQVNQFSFSTSNNISVVSTTKFNFSAIANNKIVYYLSLPVGILILLLVLKPGFITEEVSHNGELPKKKISIKLLFLYDLIISVILLIIYFMYNYKKNKVSTD